MDTAKLIEEAGREIAHMKAEALSAANPYTESTIRLTLIIDLVAALKASEERARKAEDEEEELRELVARYQEASGIDVGGDPGGVTPDVLSKFVQSEEARANAAEKQCADLAAANLAANKRIVELEHDRDAARRQAQENAEHALDLARDRDAARAELAQPSICPNCTAKMRRLDRMDSAGHAAYKLDKARKDAAGQNKRAQKAEQEAKGLHAELMQAMAQVKELRAELARLTTPRPIAEAPKEERSRILARGRDGQWREMRLVRGEWRWSFAGTEYIESPTEYFPIPVLP